MPVATSGEKRRRLGGAGGALALRLPWCPRGWVQSRSESRTPASCVSAEVGYTVIKTANAHAEMKSSRPMKRSRPAWAGRLRSMEEEQPAQTKQLVGKMNGKVPFGLPAFPTASPPQP